MKIELLKQAAKISFTYACIISSIYWLFIAEGTSYDNEGNITEVTHGVSTVIFMIQEDGLRYFIQGFLMLVSLVFALVYVPLLVQGHLYEKNKNT